MVVASTELRDAASAQDWLAAGLCVSRLVRPGAEAAALVSPWLVGVLSELGTLPPPGVIADFGCLLSIGAKVPPQLSAIDDAELRRVVRVYETEVLGRFQGESRLLSATDAIARLSVELRAEAVGVFTAGFLKRLGYTAGISFQQSFVRRFGTRATEDIVDSGVASIVRRGPVIEALIDGYTKLVRASRHTSQLITEADVFVLEHLDVLRTPSQRLEAAQLADVAAQLGRALPRRLRKQSSRGRQPTDVEDDARYPVGGFSSIETSGSIENLVTSELVYMDDEEQRLAGEIDLFEVRYVEDELLYYNRDESVLVREQRVITFVLHPELVQARFKDKEVGWQRVVILLGLLLCFVQRLSEWLTDTGLQFRVVFVRDRAGVEPLASERSLCELILSEWIEKGVAVVTDAPTWEAVLETASLATRVAQSDVVSLSTGPHPVSDVDPRLRVITLDVAEATPVLTGFDARQIGPPWQAWLQVVTFLARTLC